MLRNNVKTVRETLRLSQSEFADALQLSLKDYEAIEQERAHIDVEFCYQVVEVAQRQGVYISVVDVLYKKEDRWD